MNFKKWLKMVQNLVLGTRKIAIFGPFYMFFNLQSVSSHPDYMTFFGTQTGFMRYIFLHAVACVSVQ